MDRIKFFQDAIIDILKDNAAYYKGTTNPLNLLVIADTGGTKSRFYNL